MRQKLIEIESTSFGELDLADGDETVELAFNYYFKEKRINKAGKPYWVEGESEWYRVDMSWNEILAAVGHKLLLAPWEGEIIESLVYAARRIIGVRDTDDKKIENVKILTDSINLIRTQFMGLGLVEIEKENYHYRWNPTEKAKKQIMRLVSRSRR